MKRTNYPWAVFLLLFLTSLPVFLFSQGVHLASGIKLIAQGQLALVIDSGGLKNDGLFIADSSTVYFDGPAGTAISGSQPIVFNNLTFRGTGTKINNGDAAVLRTLAVQGTTALDADGPANDKTFTLKSSDSITANVDILTTGNIMGDVTVERFINTGAGNGQHTKSWQFLATPTNGQTIFQSWQEAGLVPAGFGTWLTGSGTGFDVATTSPSIKLFDDVTGNWSAVANTGNLLQNKLGYMLYVRGDRTVTTFNGSPNNTNMRSKGILYTPYNPPPSIVVLPNQFQSFGNPYASRISFKKVYQASNGINDVYYVWDPKLNGTWNFGGYQTLSGITGYIPTAGSASTYYPAGIPSPYIESGQAVFIKSNGTPGNINFNENCKVSGSRLVNRSTDTTGVYYPGGRQFLFTSLFSNTGMIADGNIVAFDNGLGNELNGNDAVKMVNTGENFGIMRHDKLLAVEARDPISMNDTIFYDLKNLRQQDYQFRFAPVNMAAGMTAFLIDRFNNSSTNINLADSSFVDFSINANAGSAAADRFILVFQQATVVPVLIVHIAAKKNQDNTNQVSWQVEKENNLEGYTIERSTSGRNFISIGTTLPSANEASGTYTFQDKSPLPGINYYRIRAVSNSRQVQYSEVVNVADVNASPYISIYPNPVIDKNIHITFHHQKQGTYAIKLSNKAGQLIWENSIHINQENLLYNIQPGSILAAGTYQLSIIEEDGTQMVEQVVVR